MALRTVRGSVVTCLQIEPLSSEPLIFIGGVESFGDLLMLTNMNARDVLMRIHIE